MTETIVSRYQIRIKDTDGVDIAILDDWVELDYEKEVNSAYSFSLQMFMDDTRFDDIGLDYVIEVWRSIPGVGIDWYKDFVGLVRKKVRSLDTSGEEKLVVSGFGLNELLNRRAIAYLQGTIYSDKDGVAETVMKEFVSENCTTIATIANTRICEGEIPGFVVEVDDGLGINWTGVKGFENLLDTLQEISSFANIDFEVSQTGINGFVFRTFVDQIGEDRTTAGLDPASGTNASGNAPVIFAPELGNVSEISHDLDRGSEKNVVIVLGPSEKSTQEVLYRQDPAAQADSPLNKYEIVINESSSEFQYQREDAGDAALVDNQHKEIFEFSPIQQVSTLYGLHYFFGDSVTVRYAGVERNKRIVSVKISLKLGGEESIGLTMKDVP